MKFSSLFIRRPVLGIVLNLVIALLGLVSFKFLGVRDYPSVDPPVITVSTTYTGAAPEVIEAQITEPLESSINGIAGIRTLTSSSSQGTSAITVEFNLGADLEAAANDVRDRVSRAARQLPTDLTTPPAITKADVNASPILIVTVQSDARSPIDLSQYASDVLTERVQTIPGVSEVRIFGEKRYAIRLNMSAGLMAARGVIPEDVQAALNRENVELPAGYLEGKRTELTVRSLSRLQDPKDFEDLIVKSDSGRVVRFSDIGRVEAGAENERTIMKLNGVEMIGVAVIPQPGTNYIAIADEFYKRLDQVVAEAPKDIKIQTFLDYTANVRQSIKEVLETLAAAFALVVLVIFVFLRDGRATLIPVIALPISLLGAFFLMLASGFSINILSLLAIVLATGLVVDDAIVVLENIYRKIEDGEDPVAAGHRGSAEIFFAVLSTTLTLAAVFLPIVFLQGIVGRLFREFGVVVAGAVLISAFVSLTITPMLCTRFLKRRERKPSSFYVRSEAFFERLIHGYRGLLEGFLERRWLSFAIMGLAVILIFIFYRQLPRELAPTEDRSRLSVNVRAPEGTSYTAMVDYMDALTGLIKKAVPEEKGVQIQVAPSFGGTGAVNTGSGRIILKDPGHRKRTQTEISDDLTRAVRQLSAARTIVSEEQTVSTSRRGGLPLQFVIQAPDLDRLAAKLPDFLQAVNRDPAFSVSDVDLKFNSPEVQLQIDRAKAQDLGVSPLDIDQALQLGLSGARFGYIVRGGKQYQIIGQLELEDRDDPLVLRSLYVRGSGGRLVQLDNVLRLQEGSSTPTRFRYNRFASATVSAGLSPGVTLGAGIQEMGKIAREVLGPSFSTALTGPARDYSESSSSLAFAFLFALALIYLVLAAQFESFKDPLIIMFTVPLALAGAFLSLWYFDQSLNIFGEIGIIMLIGLVTKNGILIVEFGNQRKEHGLPVREAIIESATARFRPIVMTSLTAILGSLPIALALGAGAKSRVSMGIVVIGGLLFSLALTLFVVPAFYTYLSSPVTTSNGDKPAP
ncbi:MAG: efflux RND transporter permease subunit [Fibrobacteres bacterium]|nr:efflux RND transporter permease subunit [Fibrobacterota bacterium]